MIFDSSDFIFLHEVYESFSQYDKSNEVVFLATSKLSQQNSITLFLVSQYSNWISGQEIRMCFEFSDYKNALFRQILFL